MGHDNITEIAALCKAAGKELSAAGEYFVGPATAGIDFNYLEGAMQAGILDAFKAVSVHPYRPTPPDSVLGDYEHLRYLIKKYGSTSEQQNLPIISGEWGYTTAVAPCTYTNRCDEMTQAAYLSRMWLTNTLAGALVSINYDWSDGTGSTSDCESHFGSVRQPPTKNPALPYLPKPKYTAALTLQTGLGNFQRMSKRVQATSVTPSHLPIANVFVLEFENSPNDQTGYAVWTNGSMQTGACAAPGHLLPHGYVKEDCGHYGISQSGCLSPNNPKGPGCCWEPNVTVVGGPQCYKPILPLAANFTVTFPVSTPVLLEKPGLSNPCWSVHGMLNESLGQVCEDGGSVTLSVTTIGNMTANSPVYLLPKAI